MRLGKCGCDAVNSGRLQTLIWNREPFCWINLATSGPNLKCGLSSHERRTCWRRSTFAAEATRDPGRHHRVRMAVVHHVETVTVHHLKIARTEDVRLDRMKMAPPTDPVTGAGVRGKIPAGGRRSLVLRESDMQAVVHRMVQGRAGRGTATGRTGGTTPQRWSDSRTIENGGT